MSDAVQVSEQHLDEINTLVRVIAINLVMPNEKVVTSLNRLDEILEEIDKENEVKL